MAKDRRVDLQLAVELLTDLGLPATTIRVQAMLSDVESTKPLTWKQLKDFLMAFSKESKESNPFIWETFAQMEQVTIAALGGWPRARRGHLARRGRAAPSMDRAMQRLNRVFPPIHAALEGLSRTPRQRQQAALLLTLFSHSIRWQILEDVVREWIDHWGEGLADVQRAAAVESLLAIAYTSDPARKVDTTLYHHAISHGNFYLEADGFTQFWDIDSIGQSHPLAPLKNADLLNLYNLSEMRFRTIETFARVLRAWAASATPIG